MCGSATLKTKAASTKAACSATASPRCVRGGEEERRRARATSFRILKMLIFYIQMSMRNIKTLKYETIHNVI